jgi:tetratricopeptide (TPR) repeat protein/tRNA A-37 threonylcarbamoyl transferase component Bud32
VTHSATSAAAIAAALAGRYRIERELGQGGMATVYLAEDLKHRRRVAVKVLRPDLAQSLGPTRFLREIEIAAQLAHPHILPLHDSGEADGFLYYVMPFVEGESLRQRLTRDGALRPADAARFLREIADALAHAHAHGVVHRDIKPENVMLSGRHAVVMDFGVAKAVSEAAGEGLTTVGVTLGTPAYMAPEQAVADPNIDHRADIYALGAVGYEMLTGRALYAGMAPQQVLAAHITRPPDPIPVVVNGHPVPPAFSAIVMRCLEKRADARPRDAGELVPLLEGAATPSGGTAPPDVVPVASPTSDGALRRGHPLRVAVLFVAAAAVVLAIVAFLTYRLGLPGWVVAAAAVLLLIGLPIMLVTGLYERRRARARTTALSVQPVETGVSQHFTWRKAILGGVLAFGGLAALAATYTAMRLLGIGPVGTLVASGRLAERDRLILADFENRTSDSTLGGSLTEALRVDLSQSPTVRLVDAADVSDALVRMQRPAGAPVTPAVAREVAERSGVKAVVTGQIDPVGSGYVLSAGLLSAADGRSLVAVRETAENAGALLAAIDRLSGRLRERIGESLVTIRANPALEQVTTGSLAALRKYSAGARLIDLGTPEAAIPVLEEAIALDSNFAMAWRKLAVAVGNSLGSRAREAAASTRAYRLRDRLPAAERDLATAYYYGAVEGDLEKEAAAYRSLLEREPDNQTALNNLALNYNMTRRYAAAESLGVRALSNGTAAQYFFQVMFAQVGQGHVEEARATAARAWDSLPPGTPARQEYPAFTAMAERDYPAADSIYRNLRRDTPASLEYQTRTANTLSALAEIRGRVGEAAQLQRERMATAEARGLPEDFIEGAAQLARLELRYRNRPAEALAIVQAALARHPLDSMPADNRPYLSLAEVYAGAGTVEEARRLLREYEALVPPGIRRIDGERAGSYGRVFEAEGRVAEARASYREWAQYSGHCSVCGTVELAQLHDKAGEVDSARVLYEQFVATPTTGMVTLAHSTGLAATYKRLGELYEAKGDRRRAGDYYGKFVDLWKDADPELQPGVKEVRGRLARLAQEPGT